MKGQLFFYLHLSAAHQANLSTGWQLGALQFSGVHHLARESLELPSNTQKYVDSCPTSNLLAFEVLCFLSSGSRARSSGARNRFCLTQRPRIT